MKQIILVTLAVALSFCTAAQQGLPQWTHTTPKAGNQTYLYVCEQGIGNSQQEALNIALSRVFQTTANRIGQPFDSQKLGEALQRETSLEVISQTYNIPINKVCDYTQVLQNGAYRVYILCQVAAAGNITPVWDSYTDCSGTGDDDSWRALLKSNFVPGLGQMGKGYVGEGVVTLVSEVLLVGGAVGTYYLAQDKLNVMQNPQVGYDDFTSAQKSYNTLQTTSYILWGTAAGVYVFNLIRAFTMNKRHSDGVALAPSLMPTHDGFSPAVSFTLNF